MGKKKEISLVVAAVLAGSVSVAGCGLDHDPAANIAPMQRDVYSRVEDCMLDWNDAALCARIPPNTQIANQQQGGGDHGGTVVYYPHGYYYGPYYSAGSRYVDYGGRRINPLNNSAKQLHVPPPSVQRSLQSGRPSPVGSKGAKSGGFGSSGHAASSGGG